MKRWFFTWVLVLSLSAFALNSNSAQRQKPLVSAASSDVLLYADSLQSGFQDWGWTTHVYSNTDPIYAGTNSISVSYAGNYDGLWMVNPGPGISTSGYASLRFAIHGGNVGSQQLSIKAGSGTTYPANAVSLNTYLPGGPVAGAWREVTIPLSALNLQNAVLGNLAFQSDVAGSQPTLYLDDIRLVASPSPPGGATPTIHIQTNASATPFDARLLGSNLPAWLNPTSFADGAFRARTAASGVSVLRMPGGSWSNTYDWLACENGAAPCDWASRPTDFLNFLRATGAQGMWTVSINGTSREAAALVAFFNAAITDTTPIGVDVRSRDWKTAGDWAQLRSSHGNAAPYPIKLWDVGNEVYGGKQSTNTDCTVPWGWEDVWTCDGAEYVNGIGVGANRHEGYLEFRAAMRAVDSTILVGAVGVPTANSWSNWGNEVLAAAGNVMDFYVIHQYAYDTPPSTYAEALAQPETVWTSIRADLDDAFIANAGGRNIPVAVNEYNLITVQDNDTGQMMTRAVNLLFMADTLGQIAQNGFVMANQWDLANGAAGNGTDYGLMKDSTYGYARSPQYYAYPLWARFGSQRLPVTATVSAATTLSVYAGRVDTDTLSLLAINKTDQTLTATIETDGGLTFTGGLADVAQAASVVTTTVTFNGVSNPANDLSDAPSLSVGGPASPLVYFFPPYSVTLLRLDTSAVPPSRLYLPLVLK